MILSYHNLFVFIKGLKVAGTSIEIALSSICREDDIISPITQRDEFQRVSQGYGCRNFGVTFECEFKYHQAILNKHFNVEIPKAIFYDHMPYSEVEARIGHSIDDFCFVCAERSPYYKILSLISYDLMQAGYRKGNDGEIYCIGSIKSLVGEYLSTGRALKVYNMKKYLNEKGRTPDFVCRYEFLAHDLKALFGMFGHADVSIPHVKKGLFAYPVDILQYFSKKHIKSINDFFYDEFKTFNYPFL